MLNGRSQPGAGHEPFCPVIEAFGPIADVVITMAAELDRRPITVAELVRLEEESIVTLNRPAGENIDIYIGDTLMGSGEILVIDGTLAIRVADLRDKQPTAPKPVDLNELNPAAA